MLCWLTDCPLEWLNEWMSWVEWSTKKWIIHLLQNTAGFPCNFTTGEFLLLIRNEHHLTCDTKPQMKKKELVCYVWLLVLKISFICQQITELIFECLLSIEKRNLCLTWECTFNDYLNVSDVDAHKHIQFEETYLISWTLLMFFLFRLILRLSQL